MARPWRDALAGGFAGTAVMTASLALEARVRTHHDGPVDYDASNHVVVAAAAITGWDPRTRSGRRMLFNLVHWGYGSAVGLEYEALRRRLGSDAAATAAFFAACQAMAFTLFPLFGDTPPPWRWKRSLLVSSVVQHGLYAGTVALVSRRLAAREGFARPA